MRGWRGDACLVYLIKIRMFYFSTYQTSIASQMEGNKYKLLMRMSLADLDIIKGEFIYSSLVLLVLSRAK